MLISIHHLNVKKYKLNINIGKLVHHGTWAPRTRIIKGKMHNKLGSDLSLFLIIGKCILSPVDIWKIISLLYTHMMQSGTHDVIVQS
jgi:hypothetical protein